jgi:ubiquinone/menaquinone biosynthesis C-methylase UbiE
MIKRINLGCGTNIKKGYINVDTEDYEGVDIIHDLNKYPYPFKDNSVDEVYMEHVLEHLEDQGKTIEEIYRILKKKGSFILIYPFWNSGIAHGYGHKFVYWPKFINYFLTPKTRTSKVRREYSTCLFKLRKETYIPFDIYIYKKLSQYIASLTKEVEWIMEK